MVEKIGVHFFGGGNHFWGKDISNVRRPPYTKYTRKIFKEIFEEILIMALLSPACLNTYLVHSVSFQEKSKCSEFYFREIQMFKASFADFQLLKGHFPYNHKWYNKVVLILRYFVTIAKDKILSASPSIDI
jgi:hypothetical protein